jgi:hypothetical protein
MPLLTIAASALKGPLLLRQHGGAADYSVEIAAAGQRLTVGRIMAVQRASGSERGGWLWTITGPAAPGSGIALSGEAGSVEEARRAFRATFDRLVAWSASTASGGLPWHVGAERVAGS